MYPYICHIDNFPIRSYGLVLCLAIALSIGVGYFLVKKDGKGEEKYVFDLGIYCGIAGLIGARLWDVFFFDWDYYSNHFLEIFAVWQGGMAVQGGVILGVITGICYCRWYKIDSLHLMDILSPAIIFGQGLGRCANLLNGDAFGSPTGGEFGIIYPSNTLAAHTYGSQPLWPAEVWEGQLDMVIFALLLLFSSCRHAKGQVFALYVALYSLARFGLEFLRGDYTEEVFISLTSAQTTSVVLFVLALAAFVGTYLYDLAKKKKA